MTEKSEAKRDGAKLQKNSGRGKIQKGDALLEPFCVDYKEAKKSFTINKGVWAKICGDAFMSHGFEPSIKIILGDEGEPKTRLWLIEDAMMNEMREAWLEKHGR